MASPQQDGWVVSATGLTKVYQRGREQVRALDNATFGIRRGEFVAIVGPSGSGKTTLLNLVGCMDAPTGGTLELLGKPVQHLTERERTRLRRDQLGFVFQHFGLLPTLTVAENIALPAFFAGRLGSRRLDELLAKVGLDHRRDHRPRELSGGEMQRVAIARALINQPPLLLADEPTGNLDQATGQAIIALFEQLSREGLTIVVVTHNPLLANAAHRQLELRDGRFSERADASSPSAWPGRETGWCLSQSGTGAPPAS
jgi:putative ABC transport system ATP-binding protein